MPTSRFRYFSVALLLVFTSFAALAQQPAQDAPASVGGRADRTLAEQKLDSMLVLAVRAFAGAVREGQIPPSLQPNVQSFIDNNVATPTPIRNIQDERLRLTIGVAMRR